MNNKFQFLVAAGTENRTMYFVMDQPLISKVSF